MKIFSVRQTVLPALLVLSPVVFAADEQTMIVSAAPQVVSELDTPAAVSVVDGEEMRLATPRINLSESLTGVPGLCNFAFFSGLIGAQFWAERAQPKSPELDAKLLVSC